MRSWTLSVMEEYCGLCGKLQPKGTPLQHIHIAAVERRRVRCPNCADEPVPAVIAPPLSLPRPVLRRLGYLPLAPRDPGEEG